jgi:hypothetical protein
MIIILNGTMNAGKSTVAKILTSSIKNSALLEIDYLYKMIDWMPINSAVPLNLKNAVSLIKNFSSVGINSIVPYPLIKENFDFLFSELESLPEQIYVFTLISPEEILIKNRGTRELNSWEIESIKEHLRCGVYSPESGVTVDNSSMSPQKTADFIISKICQ